MPAYSVGIWDTDVQAYVPFWVREGLASFNLNIQQLREALHLLRSMGYSAHRVRDADGTHDDNDWSVLVERTDGRGWLDIRRSWRR